ncbi:BREX-1 system adenine-specific DNA-methyltransferase PglX, partial [Lapidilactobacillus gannanensis]
LYRTNQTNFNKIPGEKIAYWATTTIYSAYQHGTLQKVATPRLGMATADNTRFLRYWYEIDSRDICFSAQSRKDAVATKKKWFSYEKGGEYRKWYGNNQYVVNWKNDGYQIRHFAGEEGKIRSHNYNLDYIFNPGITWNALSSGSFSSRIVLEGHLFDNAGSMMFLKNPQDIWYLQGLLSTPVVAQLLTLLNPTMNYQPGTLSELAVIKDANKYGIISDKSHACYQLSKEDWAYQESVPDFSPLFLLAHIAEHNRNWTVEAAFNQWKQEAQDRFDQLKKNEEELNKIFIDLYGLQDELSPEESDKEVSVRKADLGRDIRAFMSYFIGVTFGRYSLDTPGLAFAGGDWDASKYTSYRPNADDVIVLTDSDYFGDDRDIMHRFREFLTVTFGEEHLEENLTFIAKALGKAGDTAEDQIRSYLFNDFYKNHLTIYQKRPIYWQLDSGRQGGFKALMYLHRYDGDTMAMIRTSYLHTLQAAYEKRVTTLDTFITSETNTRQKNQLIKQRDHTRKQLEELVKYDAQLQHVANMHIAIDLDDGVVVNHQKVQADVKLLTPIK